MHNPLRILGEGAALAAVLGAACAPAAESPPRLLLDRSACSACSMLISEPAFAAAYRLDGRERLFDDLGCLLAALAEEADPGRARVWVHDFERHGWLAAEEATFVRAPSLHTPMGGGLVALRDPAAAAALASRAGGRTVAGLTALLSEADDDR